MSWGCAFPGPRLNPGRERVTNPPTDLCAKIGRLHAVLAMRMESLSLFCLFYASI